MTESASPPSLIQCPRDETRCKLALSCQRHQDFIYNPDTLGAVDMLLEDSEGVCVNWVIRKELDAKLRGNIPLHKQFSPGTRNIRRRGGSWDQGHN